MKTTPPQFEDIHTVRSNRRGVSGLIEGLLRRFKNAMFIAFIVPILALYLIAIGLALAPGLALLPWLWTASTDWSGFLRYPVLGFGAAASWFVGGLIIIVVVPILNLPILPFVRPGRGIWFSLQTVPWFYHNALTQLARYAILDYFTPSPLNTFFYRMMGMKIGKGSIINTSNISDPCLITIGDHVTIGGSATIFAHYGMKGYIIIDRTVIKGGCTIGLKASIMGGVTIGTNNTIAPHAVVMPKTVIPDQQR